MDFYLFQLINQFAGRWIFLDTLGIFFAEYLGYLLIFFLFLFFFLNYQKYWKLFLGSLVSAFLARMILVNIIRFIFPQPRPFVLREVNLLIFRSATPSFPSGHTAFFFALAIFVFLFLKEIKKPPKRWKLIVTCFFLGSLIIGFFRVFSGIHWPGDILGGIVVGGFSGWLTWYFFKSAAGGT